MSRFFLALALLTGAIAVCSAEDADKTAAAAPIAAGTAADAPAVIADALHSVAPNAKISGYGASSLPGFSSVIVDGHVLYVSNDGKFLIEGVVFDVARKVDLKSERMAQMRKDGIAKISTDKRLVFAPPHPKYKVTVFTDVDCPYCRQFHKQIADYNRLGIEVDYVLFPLSIHPGADKKAEAVWCSPDRNTAYTDAMNGKVLQPKTCKNPIQELTGWAMAMGLSGTPAVIAEDGTELGGYVSPEDLAQRLDTIQGGARPNPSARLNH